MVSNTRASILLIVSGGIAAYKALSLIRLLRANQIRVRCILTKGGAEFVTPLSLQTLSEETVYSDLFSLTQNHEIEHISLSRQADMIVIYPASANLLARMAQGFADDLASTVLLATPDHIPILVAPAMNVKMWEHPATQTNCELLKKRGILFADPETGAMACHEYGKGRLVSPETINQMICQKLFGHQPLNGKKALVTAGPTYEPIDPVRFLGNFSSGRQGYAIAECLRDYGAEVTLITGPTTIPHPTGMKIVPVTTAQEMLNACEAALPVDIAVMTAAVADWRVKTFSDQKIKKQNNHQPPILELTPNPDILAWISQHPTLRPELVIGFAAETQNILEHAKAKLERKKCDWIIANNVSPNTKIMGGEENEVTLLSSSDSQHFHRSSKKDIAGLLTQQIVKFFSP